LILTYIDVKRTLAIPYMSQQVETWKFQCSKGHGAASDLPASKVLPLLVTQR
jgi:hypothetical protein